jgi:ribosomal protein L22
VQVVRLVEREIRVSPLRLGLVAKHIRGLTVRQAVAQLKFSKKKHSKVMFTYIHCALVSVYFSNTLKATASGAPSMSVLVLLVY